jgi:hypothetical protein
MRQARYLLGPEIQVSGEIDLARQDFLINTKRVVIEKWRKPGRKREVLFSVQTEEGEKVLPRAGGKSLNSRASGPRTRGHRSQRLPQAYGGKDKGGDCASGRVQVTLGVLPAGPGEGTVVAWIRGVPKGSQGDGVVPKAAGSQGGL